MADDTTAFVIPSMRSRTSGRTRRAAARAKAYRQRKRQGPTLPPPQGRSTLLGILIPPASLPADGAIAEPSRVSPAVTPSAATPIVTRPSRSCRPSRPVTTNPSRRRTVGNRFHVEHRAEAGQSPNRRAVTALLCPGSLDDRGSRPRCRRCRDQRLVCSIVGIERRGGMALPGRWRGRRSGRPCSALLRGWAVAVPKTGASAGRVGRLAIDVRLCRHRRHRLRVGQHHRCCGCSGGTRNACRDGGSISIE